PSRSGCGRRLASAATRVRGQTALAAGGARFVGRELVCGAGGVRRLSALARDLGDEARIHRRKSATLLGPRSRGGLGGGGLRGSGRRGFGGLGIRGRVVIAHCDSRPLARQYARGWKRFCCPSGGSPAFS